MPARALLSAVDTEDMHNGHVQQPGQTQLTDSLTPSDPHAHVQHAAAIHAELTQQRATMQALQQQESTLHTQLVTELQAALQAHEQHAAAVQAEHTQQQSAAATEYERRLMVSDITIGALTDQLAARDREIYRLTQELAAARQKTQSPHTHGVCGQANTEHTTAAAGKGLYSCGLAAGAAAGLQALQPAGPELWQPQPGWMQPAAPAVPQLKLPQPQPHGNHLNLSPPKPPLPYLALVQYAKSPHSDTATDTPTALAAGLPEGAGPSDMGHNGGFPRVNRMLQTAHSLSGGGGVNVASLTPVALLNQCAQRLALKVGLWHRSCEIHTRGACKTSQAQQSGAWAQFMRAYLHLSLCVRVCVSVCVCVSILQLSWQEVAAGPGGPFTTTCTLHTVGCNHWTQEAIGVGKVSGLYVCVRVRASVHAWTCMELREPVYQMLSECVCFCVCAIQGANKKEAKQVAAAACMESLLGPPFNLTLGAFVTVKTPKMGQGLGCAHWHM